MMDNIIIGVYFAAIFGVSIVAHEVGHLLVLKHFTKRNVKIRFDWRHGFRVGYPNDYEMLGKADYIAVMVSGIFMGMLPLLVFINGWGFVILTLIYIGLGCRSDFIAIYERVKGIQK